MWVIFWCVREVKWLGLKEISHAICAWQMRLENGEANVCQSTQRGCNNN